MKEETNIVEKPRDRAVLVGLSSPRLDRSENADEQSLEELSELVETAGGISVGVVLQTLPSPNPRTFIGEGKVEEICQLVKSQEATRSTSAPKRGKALRNCSKPLTVCSIRARAV